MISDNNKREPSRIMSLARIMDSEVGRLSIRIISISEPSAIEIHEDNELMEILELLGEDTSIIDDDDFVTKLKLILKSCSLENTAWLWIKIYRKYPALWRKIEKDPLIFHRVNHIRNICVVSEIFSESNLRSLTDGIVTARRKLFELIQNQD